MRMLQETFTPLHSHSDKYICTLFSACVIEYVQLGTVLPVSCCKTHLSQVSVSFTYVCLILYLVLMFHFLLISAQKTR